MKLLVLAQIPPPVHGQSVMVGLLVRELPGPGIEVLHVPLSLSRSHGDIGRWRAGKIFTTLSAALAARKLARKHPGAVLYYVPAPGKSGAFWRDVIVMALVRPVTRKTVYHWHATGLTAWLHSSAGPLARLAARRWLSSPDLSIVLSPALRADADNLGSKTVAVIPNAVPRPARVSELSPAPKKSVLFLGQCSASKGLFKTVEAVLALRASGISCSLTVAGAFTDEVEQRKFARLCAANPDAITYRGEVSGEVKEQLLNDSTCLCFPSVYPHEGMPLVILEALAHGLPVVATRWRAIPDIVPAAAGVLVEPGDATGLSQALGAMLENTPHRAAVRQTFTDRFSIEVHLAAMRAVFVSLGG
jgi:glycosyltransferase involved in cell wall biosynthesis